MTQQQPGVLVFGGDIVCYELTGSGLQARALGQTGLLPVTTALEAAIRRDLDRQQAKLQAQAADDDGQASTPSPRAFVSTSSRDTAPSLP